MPTRTTTRAHAITTERNRNHTEQHDRDSVLFGPAPPVDDDDPPPF
ncbi:hypothetical protein [Mycobacterium sp. M26]|nr:hypothetical protein [Mycobacterium sp. M26]